MQNTFTQIAYGGSLEGLQEGRCSSMRDPNSLTIIEGDFKEDATYILFLFGPSSCRLVTNVLPDISFATSKGYISVKGVKLSKPQHLVLGVKRITRGLVQDDEIFYDGGFHLRGGIFDLTSTYFLPLKVGSRLLQVSGSPIPFSSVLLNSPLIDTRIVNIDYQLKKKRADSLEQIKELTSLWEASLLNLRFMSRIPSSQSCCIMNSCKVHYIYPMMIAWVLDVDSPLLTQEQFGTSLSESSLLFLFKALYTRTLPGPKEIIALSLDTRDLSKFCREAGIKVYADYFDI